ncbi:MAG: InlB B-repeat-containing protein [Oscillospiraceae bacterium]|nr:InlB B-repeat-containing protein [Oscillospiraceae bacterium]
MKSEVRMEKPDRIKRIYLKSAVFLKRLPVIICFSFFILFAFSGTYSAFAEENETTVPPLVFHKVTFIDRGKIIATVSVEHGKAASSPRIPRRTGYDLSWSEDFDNVTFEMAVNTVWTPKIYTVRFKGKGKILGTRKVEYRRTVNPVNNPPRLKNHEFIGWYTNSGYRKKFNFKNRIKKNTVIYGYYAKIPSSPARLKAERDPKGKIRLSWKKKPGLTYTVEMSNSKRSEFKRIKTTKQRFLKLSKLRNDTLYYFRIRCYKTVKGKKIYSKYSKKIREQSPFLKKWGLGKKQTKYVSLEKNYDYYIDQMYTGEYQEYNCGPSSAVIAAKWSDKNFKKTATEARASVKEGIPRWTFGWSFTTIHRYFSLNKIPHNLYVKLTKRRALAHLNRGQIFIIELNPDEYLPYNPNPEQRTGRFYSSETHFIVVKGYRVVDRKLYFETYDVLNYNRFYKDGTPKGKNRYYLAKDLIKGSRKYKNGIYAVVSEKRTRK